MFAFDTITHMFLAAAAPIPEAVTQEVSACVLHGVINVPSIHDNLIDIVQLLSAWTTCNIHVLCLLDLRFNLRMKSLACVKSFEIINFMNIVFIEVYLGDPD